TYVTGGSWELTAVMEAQKHDSAINDGGSLPGVIEIGSDLTLTPPTRDMGLAGYWTLNEGTGSVAYDSSIGGNNATVSASWTSSCKSGNCLSSSGCYGGAAYVASPNSNLNSITSFTITVWNNPTAAVADGWQGIVTKTTPGTFPSFWGFMVDAATTTGHAFVSNNGQQKIGTYFYPITGQWNFIAYVHNDSSLQDTVYFNGQLLGQTESLSVNTGAGGFHMLANNCSINGKIDDVRVYNRTLSAAEIQAIYSATK
ncbi:MAG: hypothetical protein UV58_C0004G0001, partial [Candidatus Wolfebacteria bacterium GW2011_GWC1_43_10]